MLSKLGESLETPVSTADVLELRLVILEVRDRSAGWCWVQPLRTRHACDDEIASVVRVAARSTTKGAQKFRIDQ